MALGGLVAVTVANYLGVAKTAAATRVVVAVVLAALATAVAEMLLGGQADLAWPRSRPGPGVYGVLQAAGLLFFAFAGYARLATLGEEVVDPARTIPRACPWPWGSRWRCTRWCAPPPCSPSGRRRWPNRRPLADAVAAGRLAGLEPVVRLGAAVASWGCCCRSRPA